MANQQPQSFSAEVTETVSLDYLLYLPPDYDSEDEWPLILFLHGYGERGNDIELLKRTGLPRDLANGQDLPFIIVSPQCPDNTVWPEQTTALNALLDHIIATQKVNTDRIYLTGLSMGGYGTYHLASRYPQRFAAIAPICGGGDWWMWPALSKLPIWIFHGDADEIVPVFLSELACNSIRDAGGKPELTIYPGVDHNAWDQTYADPRLYEWFLNHTRSTNA